MSEEFRTAMVEAGLVPPTNLIADGRIHRCKVEGHRKLSGAYRLSPDRAFGGFQNWSAGSEWQRWTAAKPSELTPEQRAAIRAAGRAAEAKRRAEEQSAREAAMHKASEMWGSAREGPHPYLTRKGICSNGSRVLGGLLLVPMCDWRGELVSLQTITADGDKKFLRGGKFGGAFHWIRCGEETGPVLYVCEGFATGSTIHAATSGRPVVVAFACGNLLPVCRILRDQLPSARIVVCADNDHATDGNPGVTHAKAAALAIGARLAIPHGMAGTDFNDLMIERGIDWAIEQLKRPMKPTA